MQNLLLITVAVLLPLVPAYLLFRLLPSEGSVEGPWHGLKIKLGGAFAAYFLLVVTVFGFTRTLPQYEVWTVHGEIRLADGMPFHPQMVNFSLNPPGFQPTPNGFFSLDLLAKPNIAGAPELPWLIVDHPGYKSDVLKVEQAGRRSLLKRSIVLTEPIVLEPNPITTVHSQ
jgi:hypothetical protein